MRGSSQLTPIPIACPKCCGKIVVIRYEVTLKVLRERSWQICKNCGFERSVDDFKKTLLTV